MSAKEVVVKKAKVRAYILGIIVSTIIVVFNALVGAGPWTVSLPGGPAGSFPYHFNTTIFQIFAPIFIVGAISYFMPKSFRLTPQDMAVIHTMVLTSWFVPTVRGGVMWIFWIPSSTSMGTPYDTQFFQSTSNLLYPTDPAVYDAFYFGGTLPWGAWTVPVMFWISFSLITYLICFLVGTLFRRVYIEVESLPFPLATGAAKIIESTSTSKEIDEGAKFKWLLLGFVIGVVGSMGMWLNEFVSSIPSFVPATDLTPLAIIPYAPILISVDPGLISVCYMMPVTMLISAVFFSVVYFWIFPAIKATILGEPPFTPGTPFHVATFRINQLPVNWIRGGWSPSLFAWAIIITCVIWPIFRLRSSYAPIFRGLLKRVKGEEREPLPYKWTWISIIVLMLIYSGVFSAATGGVVPFWMPLIFIIVNVIILGLGWARLRGDFGGTGAFQNTFLATAQIYPRPFWTWFFYYGPIGDVLKTNMTAGRTTYFLGYQMFHEMAPMTVTTPTILESYKLGELTETRSKDIFFAGLISIILSTVISIPLILTFTYAFGSRVNYGPVGSGPIIWPQRDINGIQLQDWHCLFRPWFPDVTGSAINFTLGVLFAIGLFLIREKFPSFPVQPIALPAIMALSPGLSMPLIVALVLKYLTIRFGGVRFYEEKGLPIFTGIISAYCVMSILSRAYHFYVIMA